MAMNERVSFSVEVPRINLIHAEVLAVTSAMRKNQRWSSNSNTQFASSYSYVGLAGGAGRGAQTSLRLMNVEGGRKSVDAALMSAFMALKMELRDIQDLSQLDALTLLHPFLQVIRSPETSGPITATALSSVDKFITYSILQPGSPSLALAIAQLSTAGTHCKFEASDSVSDEVVLLKILDLLRNCLTGKLGAVLSDESVCEMMETGLSMCCQLRLSEMLRRSAERTMQAMIATVFSKLRHIPAEDELELESVSPESRADQALDVSESVGLGLGGVRMSVPDFSNGAIGAAASEKLALLANADTESLATEVLSEPSPKLADTPAAYDETNDDTGEIVPFGLASIKELLRVLISLLNPHDQQHTDTMRLMALGLLNTAIEVGGRSIGNFPSLRLMVADQLCKHLFQLARSDNIQLLSASLRVITNIFDTMREHLKLQQELFLSFLMDRLVLPLSTTAPGTRKAEVEQQLDASTWGGQRDSGASTPQSQAARERERDRDRESRSNLEARELMMEVMGHLSRGEYALMDLWVNYDCNIECEDLYERLIKFLSRGVFPFSAGPALQDNAQLLCLDTILEQIKHMTNRLDNVPYQHSKDGLSVADLTERKANKQILLEGAASFNLKPKVGLKFLEENGVIYADPSIPREESLARFFKTTPRLDKKLLGDFISRPDQLEVLRAFMRLMEFDGKIICDAMRELLEAFRLPGESQQIARITETFAEVYFATNPPDIKSQDATYVLSYSVIMLNTDLHNPQVRKRMDITAYSRNLRGVNDDSDFSPEYLKSIYDSIRKREIVMPEEHQNQVGFEYGWKELLRRTRQAGPFVSYPTPEFDRAMFAVSWKPIVSAMSFAFANFHDDYMIQRTIAGFNQCAALAARFGMPEVFDFLIQSLSRVTALTQGTVSPDLGTFPIVDVEGQKVTVSPLAVKFGLNVKAQLAAVVLFTIANNNGPSIREGWTQIFEIYQTLFIHSLLPPSLLVMEDFLSGASLIPLKPKAIVTPREDRRNDGGLLSTLSSYLLSPYSSSNEPSISDFTDDDIETTLSAVDCIASCRIEELYAQVLHLHGEELVAPVTSLITLAERTTVDRLRPRASSLATTELSPQINLAVSRVSLSYDPSAVLLLEILTSVVTKAGDSVVDLWPLAFDFLSKLLTNANSFSSLFNERVVASLLRLASVVIRHDELRDSTFLALDMLRSLSPAVLGSVAEPLMAGLSKLCIDNADRIHSTTEWNLMFALFMATLQQEEAAKLSFGLMQRLAAGSLGSGLRENNYASFLRVLVGFANVAGAPAKSSERTSCVPCH